MTNISYELWDASTGMHTPVNVSYTKFPGNSLETFHGLQRNGLTVERLDGEHPKTDGNRVEEPVGDPQASHHPSVPLVKRRNPQNKNR